MVRRIDVKDLGRCALNQLALHLPPPEKKKKRPKYNNTKVDGFDSKHEKAVFERLEACRRAADPAERVIDIKRQVKFLLIPKQEELEKVEYWADFVVLYADGHGEVIDAKSEITRKESTYVIKKKLMRYIHNIKIKEL